VSNVRIRGNFIGTDPSGTVDEGNGGSGVEIVAASNNAVGGTAPASRNLISGNGIQGVYIRSGTPLGDGPAKNNAVRGNLIDTKKDGIGARSNDRDGVEIYGESATGNSVLSNTIFANGGLGVDLGSYGPTPSCFPPAPVLSLVHRSTWKALSANFGFTAFQQVRMRAARGRQLSESSGLYKSGSLGRYAGFAGGVG